MSQEHKFLRDVTHGMYFQKHPHVHSCAFSLIIMLKRLHFHPSLTYLVPAKVESGRAQRKNVLELALFMGVATTIHLMRPHMGFKETVLTLLSR